MKRLVIAIVIAILLVLILITRPRERMSDPPSSNNYAYELSEARTPDGRLIYNQFKGIAYEHRDTGMF